MLVQDEGHLPPPGVVVQGDVTHRPGGQRFGCVAAAGGEQVDHHRVQGGGLISLRGGIGRAQPGGGGLGELVADRAVSGGGQQQHPQAGLRTDLSGGERGQRR